MPFAVHWFRRDLRLDDNTALFHALRSGFPVLPLFIFDREILDLLPAADARVDFIHRTLSDLKTQLQSLGSDLVLRYGKPEEVWQELMQSFDIQAVYTNHDYEPYARSRDPQIAALLAAKGISFHTFRDQVLFEKTEVLSGSNSPYTVFTPYSRRWRALLEEQPERLQSVDIEELKRSFAPIAPQETLSLAQMGFQATDTSFPSRIPDEEIIRVYDERRNFPAEPGTTRIGLHLRFGTISIRKLTRTALSLNQIYLNELIWREFYMQILWNFPHVAEGPFRPEYAAIAWRQDTAEFEAWKEGRTGYPLVDAGMRELNATGFMHNRVRMVVASFLSKHLLLPWQWGEAYFAEKLLDFELASNNGGWQWAAGCGTDAAPYFRIFNPEAQMTKFDPQGKYVRKWVPEFGTPLYPRPIVKHEYARERCLAAYKVALK